MRIAIIGGGISGLTAAWQLSRLRPQSVHSGRPLEVVLFEASKRLGGIIETVREGGFILEAGPDAWLTAKPWASDLARELGLGDELIGSNDASRKIWLYRPDQENASARLIPMPDGMTLMVPSDLDALEESPLFSPEAVAAYRREPARADELRRSIPDSDESVASFTMRHFGAEVVERIAAPLLSGVFGGDAYALSARAAMPALVEIERTSGSLIAGLQLQKAKRKVTGNGSLVEPPLFTTLRSGVGTLVDRMTAQIPVQWVRLNTSVNSVARGGSRSSTWLVTYSTAGQRTTEAFDRILIATPAQTARALLQPVDSAAARLIPEQASSAVLVAYGFTDAASVPVPPGFGLIVPPTRPGDGANPSSLLQACTFADQKFPDRVPPGGRVLRAFFSGAAATRLANCNNDEIAVIGRVELARVLHSYIHRRAPLSGTTPRPLPEPLVTVVRRLPLSLPQYTVGHLDRVQELNTRMNANLPGITLLGNSLHGLGIPDVIRDAVIAAKSITLAG